MDKYGLSIQKQVAGSDVQSKGVSHPPHIHPKQPYLCTPWAKKVFLETWDCVWNEQCLKISWGSVVAPQTPIPLHTMGMFEMDNAK